MRPSAILTLTIDPRLKELIGKSADDADLAMNEYVAKAMAEILGRPDLAGIPRKPMGRPRKELVAS